MWHLLGSLHESEYICLHPQSSPLAQYSTATTCTTLGYRPDTGPSVWGAGALSTTDLSHQLRSTSTFSCMLESLDWELLEEYRCMRHLPSSHFFIWNGSWYGNGTIKLRASQLVTSANRTSLVQPPLKWGPENETSCHPVYCILKHSFFYRIKFCVEQSLSGKCTHIIIFHSLGTLDNKSLL